MKHSEIRRTFLAYFAERGHTIVPSSSLIPKDDPTLLFTSAGMVQFKPLFAGSVPLPYTRATSIQKCLRGSDLAEVGKSVKHLTFFEMLGNFSFGDYFKKEGIEFAWDYLTNVVKLDPAMLSVSVYEEDAEAWEIWHRHIGLPEKKIFRLGAKDNFWGPAGGVGACGPCTEIYADLGPEFGCGKADCAPGCDCPRFTEVYNVVFPQYDQQPDGTRLPLKNRGIDTGMGMERLAMISQQAKSLFETDLLLPLVRALGNVVQQPLNDVTRTFFYAACDHARALTFAIADGAIPSNEARGYMLRSILRRALILAWKLGIQEAFLYRLSGEVVELMRPWYPELAEKREQAALIIKSEEERFLATLEAGMARWQEVAERCRNSGIVPGEEAFRLHDTYGFHIELMRELAAEQGLTVDDAGFARAMQTQRERSKRETFLQEGVRFEAAPACKQDFCGYDRLVTETVLTFLRPLENDELEVALETVPFYAEAGGQVGDTGRIAGEDFELEVLDTYYRQGLLVCRCRVISGTPKVNVKVKAEVDLRRRRETERAHTATHLLHAALRCIVGDYVKQEGSRVEPGRLRFDFTAFQPLTPEQLSQVEGLVYRQILADIPVEQLRDLPIEEARKLGALAFFGETYGERVNVIRIGDFSAEFCGGTHLRRTGEIGVCRIISESGVAAGIRRIEALVGETAFRTISDREAQLAGAALLLGGDETQLAQRVNDLLATRQQLESRVRSLTAHLVNVLAEQLLKQPEEYQGIRLVLGDYDYLDLPGLRLLADALRQLCPERLIGLLIAAEQPQIRFLVFVTPDLNRQFPAGRLAKEIGRALGGGGGGKPDLAEGGGRKDLIPAGFTLLRKLISEPVSAG